MDLKEVLIFMVSDFGKNWCCNRIYQLKEVAGKITMKEFLKKLILMQKSWLEDFRHH